MSLPPQPSPDDPFSYSYWTYVLVIGLALWGGLAGYLHRINEGSVRSFSIASLCGELTISGFVGLVTFWGCQSWGLDITKSAIMGGIAGHMGSRAIFLLERYFHAVLDKRVALREEQGSQRSTLPGDE